MADVSTPAPVHRHPMQTAAFPSDPSPSRAADEERIVHTLITVATASTTRDPHALGTVYACDADWIDAFGTVRHGRQAIIERLDRLVADPRFTLARLVGRPELSLRWLDDDTVIATTSLERRRQQTIDGPTLPPRRTHSLRVLTRREQDTWQIVSQIDNDALDDDGSTTGPPT
jgi:uncharacterized protein (TIGR02246 family)